MPKIGLKAHFEPLVARFGSAQPRLTSGRAVSAAWQRGRGRTVLPVSDLYGQGSYLVRLDWGAVGAQACLADVCVVVDVLSFSTSVTIAVERGMQVLPFPSKDARAADFARENDAVLAVGRLEATKDGAVPSPSLSWAGLLACDPVPRLVLPSPNGSTIAAALREVGSAVLVGCLRNAAAVGRHLAVEAARGHSVAVVAAGERWGSDDSLRPALEDYLGAGAIISVLLALSPGLSVSPEAQAAARLFDASEHFLESWMRDSVGGRELSSLGFDADVAVATDLNSSDVVPAMVGATFTLLEMAD